MTSYDLAKLMKNLRESEGMDRKQWAEHLNITPKQLLHWETGSGLMSASAFMTALERAGRDVIIGPKRGV